MSRTTFPTLFKAIGSSWGEGDGATTFNLPDLRGEFLRGVDPNGKNGPDYQSRLNWQGQQVGAVVGSFQPDEFKSHNHGLRGDSSNLKGGRYIVAGNHGDTFQAALPTGSAGGNETRPKNACVYYIIKY